MSQSATFVAVIVCCQHQPVDIIPLLGRLRLHAPVLHGGDHSWVQGGDQQRDDHHLQRAHLHGDCRPGDVRHLPRVRRHHPHQHARGNDVHHLLTHPSKYPPIVNPPCPVISVSLARRHRWHQWHHDDIWLYFLAAMAYYFHIFVSSLTMAPTFSSRDVVH